MLGQNINIPGQAPGVQGTRLCHLLSDETLLRRLSGNTGEDCVSALRSLNLPDSFWTDEFKVVPCAKTYSHKWTLCPCAHIGETARRRCPRSVNYKAVLCPLVKAKKTCPLGDSCSYAHNVFEHWLHPSRYKTRLCSFGRNCNRSICFFAHSADELRCVPCTDDKEGDEREYLMQIIMAQESGLLPPTTIEQIQPAPIPPIIPNLMPDLGSAFQQALQQPLPPSNRPSMSGLPDAATLMSARPSMSGIPDLMAPARSSMSGLSDAAVLRASMSGVPDATSMMLQGRPSLNGLPDRANYGHTRSSLSGLHHEGLRRGRPSMNGIPDHANMLLSMSIQGSMQRAMSNDLNAVANMQRAMSNDLGAPFHTAAAVQHALGYDPAAAVAAAAAASAPLSAAAAAATAMAMERAISLELGGGGGSGGSPLQATGAATAALERAYSQREMAAAGVGNTSAAIGVSQHGSSLSSRSLGSSVRRDLNLAHTPSINSVESDSLVQLRGGVGAAGSTGFAGTASAMGFDSQGPPRLSDPGANLQGVPGGVPVGQAGGASGLAMPRASDSGAKFGSLLGGSDLAGLESLLPLMNNALASGALALPGGAPGMRRSNSGSNSGRVLSPQLQENSASSPLHSGSLTPLSTNSASEPHGLDPAIHQQQQQLAQQLLQQLPGSPPGAADSGAAYEGMLRNSKAAAAMAAMAAGPGGAAGFGVQVQGGGAGAAAGGVDQAYLNDLVARLQDQGVNKEQLVSSLSQLLAQLLSVSS